VAKAAAGFTEDLLEAAVGLKLAPAGPDSSDPRRPLMMRPILAAAGYPASPW
jgi:hypothetical protein